MAVVGSGWSLDRSIINLPTRSQMFNYCHFLNDDVGEDRRSHNQDGQRPVLSQWRSNVRTHFLNEKLNCHRQISSHLSFVQF